MNRAWIPAGALAGVSVAGLLALGPLTDSMSPKVSFEPAVATVADTNSSAQLPVSVRLNQGIRGVVVTKSAGGRLTAPVNGDSGLVGYRKNSARSSTATAGASTRTRVTVRTVTPAKKVVKKAPKRQGAIGGSSETNSSSGLANGAGSGQQGAGEQASTLPGDGN
jgi:hypothetical protein